MLAACLKTSKCSNVGEFDNHKTNHIYDSIHMAYRHRKPKEIDKIVPHGVHHGDCHDVAA